jgi:transcriptional regulator with XRE-family HTH domain
MSEKVINRLKAVLAEKQRTNKWLAEELGKSLTTVSRWCTNETQPSLEILVEIADILDVDIRELIVETKNNHY